MGGGHGKRATASITFCDGPCCFAQGPWTSARVIEGDGSRTLASATPLAQEVWKQLAAGCLVDDAAIRTLLQGGLRLADLTITYVAGVPTSGCTHSPHLQRRTISCCTPSERMVAIGSTTQSKQQPSSAEVHWKPTARVATRPHLRH